MYICVNIGLNRKLVLFLYVCLVLFWVVCWKCDRRGKIFDVVEIIEFCCLYEKWGYINNVLKICMGCLYWYVDYKY